MHEWTLLAELYCHSVKNATIFDYIHVTLLLNNTKLSLQETFTDFADFAPSFHA